MKNGGERLTAYRNYHGYLFRSAAHKASFNPVVKR